MQTSTKISGEITINNGIIENPSTLQIYIPTFFIFPHGIRIYHEGSRFLRTSKHR